MGLRAFNKTGVALELKDDAGVTFATLPPSTSAPEREGKGIDIKSEVLLFVAADFAALEAQREADDVVFAWDSVPEFPVGALVVNFPFAGGVEVIYAPGHPSGSDEGLLGIYTDWLRAFAPCRIAANANRPAKFKFISRHSPDTHDSDGFGGFTIASPAARVPLPVNPGALAASFLGPGNRWNFEGIQIEDDDNPQPGTIVSFEDEAGIYNPTSIVASFIQFVKSTSTVLAPVMLTAKGCEMQGKLGGRFLVTDAAASPVITVETGEPFGFIDFDGVGGIGPVEDAGGAQSLAPVIDSNGVFLAINIGGNCYIRSNTLTSSTGGGFCVVRIWAATGGYSRHSLEDLTFPNANGLSIGIARYNGNSRRVGQGRNIRAFGPYALVNAAASPYKAHYGEVIYTDDTAGPVTVQLPFGGPAMMDQVSVTKVLGGNTTTVLPAAANPFNTASADDTVNGAASDVLSLIGTERNYRNDAGSGPGQGVCDWNVESAWYPPSSAYTRNAALVEDRTLLASASATTLNNNNVLAALIADLQARGVLG